MKQLFSKNHDWFLIGTIFLLTIFGLVMVFSSSYVWAFYQVGDYYFFIQRQLIWFGIATVMFIIFMNFSYPFYRKMSMPLVLLSILLLVLVVLFGVTVNHAQRWLDIGPFRIQPSEFVKIFMIIYLAQVYSSKQAYINKFIKGVLPPLIVVCVILGLIMKQPDLGTATSILLVTGLIVFFSGAKVVHLILLSSVGIGMFALFATSADYRMARLISYRDPFEYAAKEGYQLIQSYVAIAHGGLSGVGLGQSVQKLMYLPEPHTDFIFSIISEELGIIGVLFVLTCYSIILVKGVIIGAKCKNPFGSLLAYGITFQVAIQVVFNIGAVTGLLPITGIPLPLISNGGSSLLVTMVSLAILANIAKSNRKQQRNKEDLLQTA
ncbi:putative lipid II flippase FtsW [Bacillus alkalicellulosilyticus]|uniref:putative lipid II flippase FtsW n=1 Tax=Alkalihalobacterium alkalicellulosilyticum TaxID=1912214 RepID=UPI000998C3BC|nr:putative lipid II flippase FtsW [Bacillus alkalicellulosilyticus]